MWIGTGTATKYCFSNEKRKTKKKKKKTQNKIKCEHNSNAIVYEKIHLVFLYGVISLFGAANSVCNQYTSDITQREYKIVDRVEKG